MKQTRLWMDMTWPDIHLAAEKNKVLIVVVGTVEQHGPALPTGVDVYLPMAVAERVAEAVDGVVAPCSNYGYKSLLRAGGGPAFPGSIGLRGTTVIALVTDIMMQFIHQGWRRIVVLDWHLENVPFVYEGIDEAVRMAGNLPGLKIVKIDNPNALGVATAPELESELFGSDFPGWVVEHASVWETSAMLAAHPEKVQVEKIVDGRPPEPLDYDVIPVPKHGAPESGVFWKATRSSREKGERILACTTDGIVNVIKKEFGFQA